MTVHQSSSEATRTPLRALRQQPLLVDLRAVGERMRTGRTPGRSPVGGALPSSDDGRWARAWLVCAQATLVRDPRYGLEEPWAIPFSITAIRAPRGASDPERLAGALAALEASGIIRVDGNEGPEPVARIGRQFFMPHPAAVALDWTESIAACGNEPATLLVLHALAEMVVPLDAWTAVPRRDLVEATGYQQKQVRVALRRLGAAGLLEAEGDAGVTARYRFTGRALGRVWETPSLVSLPVAVDSTPQSVTPPLPTGSGLTPDAGARARTTNDLARETSGLRVSVGGVTVSIAPGADFEIGAGLGARLEVGEDGEPVLIVGPRRAR